MINNDYRVKVLLSKSTYEALINDMIVFEYKNGDKINKGGFINQLFASYHQTYDNQINQMMTDYDKKITNYVLNTIKDKVSTKKLNTIEKNINAKYLEYIKKTNEIYKDELTREISFKINKANQEEFETIYYNTFLPNDTVSSYFRNLLDSYARLSQDIRETIIFKKSFDKITKAIERKQKNLIKYQDNKEIISPYRFAQTIDENHNYLIGINDEKLIKGFRLCLIEDVIILNDIYIYDNNINNTIENGPEFSTSSAINVEIKLTPLGEKWYKQIVSNRPKLIKKENDSYFFYCSEDQIRAYFFTFGSNVTIVSPVSLQNRFIQEYQKSLQNYKKMA